MMGTIFFLFRLSFTRGNKREDKNCPSLPFSLEYDTFDIEKVIKTEAGLPRKKCN